MQWVIMPNDWRKGQQHIPLVYIGGMGLGLFGYAQGVARELRQRGIACCVDAIEGDKK